MELTDKELSAFEEAAKVAEELVLPEVMIEVVSLDQIIEILREICKWYKKFRPYIEKTLPFLDKLGKTGKLIARILGVFIQLLDFLCGLLSSM